MLKRLEIWDFAIIEHLAIDFNNGFCVMTGETGAGKSIIMGALNSVMGGKMETRSLRDGAKKCVIEATFDIQERLDATTDDESIEQLFDRLDLDFDAETIIRRELNESGKSRAFVNDIPTTLGNLKELGERLIDIHSQHANLLVKDKGWQMHVLDTMAETNKDALPSYQATYKQWKAADADLKRREEHRNNNSAERDYLTYQLEELKKAQLKSGEQEELEERLNQLSHAEDTRSELETAAAVFNSENGVLPQLQQIADCLQKAARYNDAYDELAQRSKSCYIELKDIANDVNNEKENVVYDPQELQKTEDRLNLIYSLEKKHGVNDLDGLLRQQAEWESFLGDDENSDEEIERLKNDVQKLKTQTTQASKKLHEGRLKAIPEMEQNTVKLLKELGMKDVRFQIDIEQTDLTVNGQDSVCFLFSANAKSGLRPIADIASGGEIARVMLTLKSTLARKASLPTILFDEIDTGISGEIADKTGRIMRDMANSMQVICITHLPQIAAQGSYHYRVHKVASNTSIEELDEKQRIEEIAQMLSGSNVTDAARKNAIELLQNHF